MSINACIYDSNHALAGCITDSVIQHFRSEFEDIKSKYFGGVTTPLLGVMEKCLVKSEDGATADFLNCLKLITRKYQSFIPAEFAQEVGRAYHSLVRYCCSQAVYDEVLEETISRFREAGLEYVGGNSYGKEQNDCQFEYMHKRVSVRMRRKEDLYRFWEKDSAVDNCATIYDGSDEYVVAVNGNASDMAEEIVACIGEDVVIPEDEQILEEIIFAIGEVLSLRDE